MGALASELSDRSAGVGEAAANALRETLPEIADEHYGLFPTRSMESLGKALQHSDSQLAGLVLDALAKVGTPVVIPHVQRLWERAKTSRQRDSAAAVLKILQERQKSSMNSERLLRPSESPIIPESSLLRPAGSGAESESESLLRPTNNLVNPN